MSCFCTGECRRTGYCPNQRTFISPPQGFRICKYCGHLHPRDTAGCPNKEDYESNIIENENPCDLPIEFNEDSDIEKGDRVWFRTSENTVIERYVHEVKNKVFGVVSRSHETDNSRANVYWYEFDNVDIIEVEKDD